MNHTLKKLPGNAHPIHMPGFWIIMAIAAVAIIMLPAIVSPHFFTHSVESQE